MPAAAPLTREEWDRMNAARRSSGVLAANAVIRKALEREKADRAHWARVEAEGPLYKLAEAEARVRAEVEDAST